MNPVEVMITVTAEPAGTQVRVDGWLTGAGVAELVRVLDAAPAPARLLVRDLRGADAAGVAVLRRLARQGTPLEGLSMYLQLMLAEPASATSLEPHSPTRAETPLRSNEE